LTGRSAHSKLIDVKVLTVRQPWAGLIASGRKDVENRTWAPPDAVIGTRIGIHAAGRATDHTQAFRLYNDSFLDEPLCEPRGVLLATVILADVVTDHPSEWALPHLFHWVLTDPRVLRVKPHMTGHTGLWNWTAQG